MDRDHCACPVDDGDSDGSDDGGGDVDTAADGYRSESRKRRLHLLPTIPARNIALDPQSSDPRWNAEPIKMILVLAVVIAAWLGGDVDEHRTPSHCAMDNRNAHR